MGNMWLSGGVATHPTFELKFDFFRWKWEILLHERHEIQAATSLANKNIILSLNIPLSIKCMPNCIKLFNRAFAKE